MIAQEKRIELIKSQEKCSHFSLSECGRGAFTMQFLQLKFNGRKVQRLNESNAALGRVIIIMKIPEDIIIWILFFYNFFRYIFRAKQNLRVKQNAVSSHQRCQWNWISIAFIDVMQKNAVRKKEWQREKKPIADWNWAKQMNRKAEEKCVMCISVCELIKLIRMVICDNELVWGALCENCFTAKTWAGNVSRLVYWITFEIWHQIDRMH